MSFEVSRARSADYSVFPLGWLSERKTSVDVTLGHGDGRADWAEGADDAIERLLPPRYKKRKEKTAPTTPHVCHKALYLTAQGPTR